MVTHFAAAAIGPRRSRLARAKQRPSGDFFLRSARCVIRAGTAALVVYVIVLMLGLFAKIWRNRPVLSALARIAMSNRPDERHALLKRVASWASIRLAQERHAIARKHVVGFAATFLARNRSLVAHLESIPHLGVLEPLAPVQLRSTRHDYALEICSTLWHLKQVAPGLGLSAPTRTADESIVVDGHPLTGLELCQTWAFLQNAGHLQGTYATERALLFQVLSSKGLVKELLNLVPSELRPAAQEILRSRSMYRFVGVLAMQLLGARESPDRLPLMAALLLLHSSSGSERMRRLRALYRLARQVTYLRLHTAYGMPGADASISEVSLADILGHDQISFEEHARVETQLSKLLQAVNDFHYSSFFTSPKSSDAVLRHLRAFKHWWRANCGRGVERCIDALRTDILPIPQPNRERALFARLDLPFPEARWRNLVADWWEDGSAWADSDNFFVSTPPDGATLTVDIYSSMQRPSSLALFNVASRLARYCAETWIADAPTNIHHWRAIARFGLACLDSMLPAGKKMALKPAEAKKGSRGLASISRDRAALAARLDLFSGRCVSPSRSIEISALAAYLRSQITSNGIYLAFLGTTTITDEAEKVIDEIDGIVLEFSETSLRVHVLESKTGKAGGGAGQLVKTMALLGSAASTVSKFRVGKQKVLFSHLDVPADADLSADARTRSPPRAEAASSVDDSPRDVERVA